MKMIKNKLKHVQFLYKNGGLSKLAVHLRDHVLFDLANGTDTSGWLEKDDFQFHPESFNYGVRYRASSTQEILQSLKKISGLISSPSFYDLGCGKGKVLCLARRSQEFQRVVGVDYYQPFLDTAQKNLINLGIFSVELVRSDMGKFQDFEPRSVIFFYNPAEAPVIQQVCDNVQKICEQAIIIYNKPLHEYIFKGWKTIDLKTSDDPDCCTSIFGWGLN